MVHTCRIAPSSARPRSTAGRAATAGAAPGEVEGRVLPPKSNSATAVRPVVVNSCCPFSGSGSTSVMAGLQAKGWTTGFVDQPSTWGADPHTLRQGLLHEGRDVLPRMPAVANSSVSRKKMWINRRCRCSSTRQAARPTWRSRPPKSGQERQRDASEMPRGVSTLREAHAVADVNRRWWAVSYAVRGNLPDLRQDRLRQLHRGGGTTTGYRRGGRGPVPLRPGGNGGSPPRHPRSGIHRLRARHCGSVRSPRSGSRWRN